MPDASSPAAKRARLLDLVRSRDVCVLATASLDVAGQPVPHCSLMAYLPGDEPIRELFVLTSRQTRKFESIARHALVSLLVDSREDDLGERRGQARALTVAAEAEVVADETESGAIRRRLLERHPHLAELAAQPGIAVLRLRLKEFTYLEGATDAYRGDFQSGGKKTVDD